MHIPLKFWEKRKLFQIFVNFKANLIKILIGLWKYFAISKRLWVNYYGVSWRRIQRGVLVLSLHSTQQAAWILWKEVVTPSLIESMWIIQLYSSGSKKLLSPWLQNPVPRDIACLLWHRSSRSYASFMADHVAIHTASPSQLPPKILRS